MGGCCYTPRRTQFLWWYWLLLASIVGIPMLVACLYVARHQIVDDEDRKRIGKIAALIFWIGALLTAVLVVIAGFLVYELWGDRMTRAPFEEYFLILLIGYLGGLIAFTSIEWSLVRLLAAIAGYGIYLAVVFVPASVPELFWLPAVCAGTAYFFTRFKAQPTPKTARAALLAGVVGAFLFWGVIKYGRWVNFALYCGVRGQLSNAVHRDVDLESR